jgi:hypothetical protein
MGGSVAVITSWVFPRAVTLLPRSSRVAIGSGTTRAGSAVSRLLFSGLIDLRSGAFLYAIGSSHLPTSESSPGSPALEQPTLAVSCAIEHIDSRSAVACYGVRKYSSRAFKVEVLAVASPKDLSSARVATDELEGRHLSCSDAQVNELGGPNSSQRKAAAAAEQWWNRLAQQGKWMIVVYRSGQSTISDVVRLTRAHLNDQCKVRIAANIGCVVRQREVEALVVDDGRILDVPENRILWYEIIDEIGPKDVPLFRAAWKRGVRASRKFAGSEAELLLDAVRVRPR